MSEKLQKVLARAGYASRREVESMISQGRVSINGRVATLGERVELNPTLRIQVNGKPIFLDSASCQHCRVLAYYKPEGEICTRDDPEGRSTVFKALPPLNGARWIAIGRLDINTSGLLLFTTDGELANRLMHPRHQIEREYAVRVFGEVDKEKCQQLTKGVMLDGKLAAFKKIQFSGGEGVNQWYHVTLTEGRNREVRRLWDAADVTVSRLIRVRYGDIQLPKSLSRGRYQELDTDLVNSLRRMVKLSVEVSPQGAIKNKEALKKTKTMRPKRGMR